MRIAVSLIAFGMLFLGLVASPNDAPTTSAPVYAKQVLTIVYHQAKNWPTGPETIYGRKAPCFQYVKPIALCSVFTPAEIMTMVMRKAAIEMSLALPLLSVRFSDTTLELGETHKVELDLAVYPDWQKVQGEEQTTKHGNPDTSIQLWEPVSR